VRFPRKNDGIQISKFARGNEEEGRRYERRINILGDEVVGEGDETGDYGIDLPAHGTRDIDEEHEVHGLVHSLYGVFRDS
jgi:hypothetical protein